MTQQEPGERVAAVTYLFGARPTEAPAVSAIPSKSETVSMPALTRRGLSVAEMTRLLAANEIGPEEIQAEITRLEGVGLLDDAALAGNLVRTLRDRKGLGRKAIGAELHRRGIDQGVVDEALASIGADDELARAVEVATKRAAQLRGYDVETAKRRLGAFLQRRGYSGSIVSAAMGVALTPSRAGGVRFE